MYWKEININSINHSGDKSGATDMYMLADPCEGAQHPLINV